MEKKKICCFYQVEIGKYKKSEKLNVRYWNFILFLFIYILGETSDILQKVRLAVADKTSCANTYKNHNINLTKTQICAGGAENKDSCPGDSGGPMMVATLNSNSDAIYVQQVGFVFSNLQDSLFIYF